MDGTNASPPTKVDLSLIPLEDILKELFKRHDSVIFAGVIHKNVSQYTVTRRYYGHRYSCLALCSNLTSIINDDENKSLGPVSE